MKAKKCANYDSCHNHFVPLKEWHELCQPCYRAKRSAEPPPDPLKRYVKRRSGLLGWLFDR